MKTIVIGLGNPLLGDDGVGWSVADQVRQELLDLESSLPDQVDVLCLSVGGLTLMEHLVDYDRAIIIDAITLETSKIGGVVKFSILDIPDVASGHTSSAHDTTLQTAIKLGIKMGVKIPDKIEVIGINTTKVYDFSENLSPEVEASIPVVTQIVVNMIKESITKKENFKSKPGGRK